ncbi:hypothetical protein L1887_43254 [Cichorium endivia]|nr:hypothetical protein L1887_43254 [Cichorium endivia]
MSASSSDRQGKPWLMPEDLRKLVIQKEEEIESQNKSIRQQKKQLDEMQEEVVKKIKWVKKTQQDIKQANIWVQKQKEAVEQGELELQIKVKEMKRKNNWVLAEKKKYPLDFPDLCDSN